LKHLHLFTFIIFIWLTWPNVVSAFPDSTDKARMELLYELPSEILESSGLIFFNNEFWTFNDSGAGPILYALEINTGKILRRVTIKNATNIDWEEATQDENYIYIGDFGNNFGNRKDLKVYRISKSDILAQRAECSVQADITSFSFADQKEFKNSLLYTRFDCEAMVIWGDSIIIFTKNWKEETSSAYCIPKSPGIYNPSPAFVFQSRGLVTGAAISPDKKELAICGYEEFIPFIWLIKMGNSIDFRKNAKTRRSFMNMAGVQIEGICFGPHGYIFLSCERSRVPGSLFRLNPIRLRKWR
jgi:hypothetical protein